MVPAIWAEFAPEQQNLLSHQYRSETSIAQKWNLCLGLFLEQELDGAWGYVKKGIFIALCLQVGSL